MYRKMISRVGVNFRVLKVSEGTCTLRYCVRTYLLCVTKWATGVSLGGTRALPGLPSRFCSNLLSVYILYHIIFTYVDTTFPWKLLVWKHAVDACATLELNRCMKIEIWA